MASHSDDTYDISFRLGAGALGLFAGTAIGLLVAWLGYIVVGTDLSFAKPAFGGAFAGLVSGLVLPGETLSMVELVLHFFVGFFAASAGAPVESLPDTPGYLKLACLFGGLLAVALVILS